MTQPQQRKKNLLHNISIKNHLLFLIRFQTLENYQAVRQAKATSIKLSLRKVLLVETFFRHQTADQHSRLQSFMLKA